MVRNSPRTGPVSLLIILTALTCVSSTRTVAQNFSESTRREDFKTFLFDFRDNYAYLDRAEKPWETWDRRYSAAVDSANSPEAYAAVFESALDELHDFHAEVRSRNPHRWLPVPTFAAIGPSLEEKMRWSSPFAVGVRRNVRAFCQATV